MFTSEASSARAEGSHTDDGIVADTSRIVLPRERSPAALARIRTKNRRKRYLDLHPEYFSSSLELAGLQNIHRAQLPVRID